MWTSVKFYSIKNLFKLIKQKESLETKIFALVSVDLDKWLGNSDRFKMRG